MNKKYEYFRVSVVQIDSNNVMLFSDTIRAEEYEFPLYGQQTELLAWLVNKHVPLYQGTDEEIPYAGKMTPIDGDKSSEALKLIKRLRRAKPSKGTYENIREFMLDLAEEVERLEYIFCNHENDFIRNRFCWLFDLANDIQTLVDGFVGFRNKKISSSSQHPLGGGNLAIPILVCTGLELVSALHSGETRYLYGNKSDKYDPERNVDLFIRHYFDDNFIKIPRLIWDGVRNGVDHLFIPKTLQCNQNRIHFNFRVDESLRSDVDQSQGVTKISIASVKFYKAFMRAVEKYKIELISEEGLQRKFIKAWSSIEEYNQNISANDLKMKEVDLLLKDYNQNGRVQLFD